LIKCAKCLLFEIQSYLTSVDIAFEHAATVSTDARNVG